MRHFVMAFALVSAGSAGAQPAAAPAISAPALDHVGIQASDLDRSVAFYTRLLA